MRPPLIIVFSMDLVTSEFKLSNKPGLSRPSPQWN